MDADHANTKRRFSISGMNLSDTDYLLIAWLVSDIAHSTVVGLPYDSVTWAAYLVGNLLTAVLMFFVYRKSYWATLAFFVCFAIGSFYPLVEIFKADLWPDKILRAIQFALTVWASVISRRILREISLAKISP
jgi:hypothetical protein